MELLHSIAHDQPFLSSLLSSCYAPPLHYRRTKAGANIEHDFGGVVVGDRKDSTEFAYLTYRKVPRWIAAHRSLMRRTLTQELFERLKHRRTKSGYTLSNCIQTGVETPHLGVGATAGDEESYKVFKELFNPIIAGWHGGYDAATQIHPTDLDPSHLRCSAAQKAKLDRYVISTRIRAARNIRGHPLPPGSTKESAAAVEALLVKTFSGLTGDLQGQYFPLGNLGPEEEQRLQEKGFLFQKPKTTNLLTNAGAARFWPESRGIFHNASHTALCWCNEEDHCRIISMQDGGDVKAVFTRFCALSEAMKASTEAAGASLMHNAALGYIGTCPSNLGTGMRASVMIELANLNENVPLLHKICEMYDLQPRGSAGEHSAALGARWDISNKQRIGFSEVELAQKMIDGVCMVICAEEALASGTTPAALAAATAPASLKVLLNVIPTPECVKACGTDACDGGHHKACQHARAAADSPLSNLFGTTIVTKDGERDTNEVLAGKKHIMVYFSAH